MRRDLRHSELRRAKFITGDLLPPSLASRTTDANKIMAMQAIELIGRPHSWYLLIDYWLAATECCTHWVIICFYPISKCINFLLWLLKLLMQATLPWPWDPTPSPSYPTCSLVWSVLWLIQSNVRAAALITLNTFMKETFMFVSDVFGTV